MATITKLWPLHYLEVPAQDRWIAFKSGQKTLREQAKNNVQILPEHTNVHQRKKGKTTHPIAFFPPLLLLPLRSVAGRWRHLLILHAGKQTEISILWGLESALSCPWGIFLPCLMGSDHSRSIQGGPYRFLKPHLGSYTKKTRPCHDEEISTPSSSFPFISRGWFEMQGWV